MLLGKGTSLLSSSPPRISFISSSSRSPSPHSTALFMSDYAYTTKYPIGESYGIEGPPREKEEIKDPEAEVQAYVVSPASVVAKPNLDGTVLVSGWVKSRERTDQNVFDLLNHEESAMKFSKIVAFVNDVKFAKKRLLSRSARYTGLLDKLEFIGATEEDGLPTVEQLAGVKHWVANVENGDLSRVEAIATLCRDAGELENVAVLLSGAGGLDADKCKAVIQSLSNEEKYKFAVVAVGELKETPEGSLPYDIENFGTEGGVVPEGVEYSRIESLRAVTECLQLESGANKALTFTEITNTNTTENVGARLIKGLREAGYTRAQEIDHMVSKGVTEYTAAMEKYKQDKWEKENPDPEKVAKELKERDQKDAISREKLNKEKEATRQKEVDKYATDWAKRDYFRQTMGGSVGMNEEEYVKKVWDKALLEGDIMYRQLHGGAGDARKDRADFDVRQEKKKEAALKKAKKALEGKMGDLIYTDADDDDEDDVDESDDKKDDAE